MFSSFGADRPARVSSGPPLVACGSRTVLPDKGDPRAIKQSQQLPAPDWLRTHLPPPALPDHPAAKQYLPITQEMPPAKAVYSSIDKLYLKNLYISFSFCVYLFYSLLHILALLNFSIQMGRPQECRTLALGVS